MTPQRLFQILITDGPPADDAIKDSFTRNVESFKLTYKGAQYERYDNEAILDFLSANHPGDVLDAYRAITPYAFKADLARYCLLYTYGGLYSDLSYLHVRAIDVVAGCDMVVFRDIAGHPSWATSNAIIYAKPASPILERAINRVVANFKAGFYGHSPLEPTGPYMFGSVLAETADWHTVTFGDSQLLNIDRTGRPNIVKVMPGGEVVAIRNKTSNSQITDLVATGGNDYDKLWKQRRIWGEPGDDRRRRKFRWKLKSV